MGLVLSLLLLFHSEIFAFTIHPLRETKYVLLFGVGHEEFFLT